MEQFATIFVAVWLLLTIPVVIFALRGIRKAKQTFESIEKRPVVFREKGISGYSKKSLITRLGGSNKVLEVLLTDTELGIRGVHPIFTFIGSFYDLSHRIKRENIINTQKVKKHIELTFMSESGHQTEIVLVLKNGDRLLAALGR